MIIIKIEDVSKIGVLGAGIMGHGIAQVCATYGYNVVMVDISMDILRRALENIKSGRFGLERLAAKGKIEEKQIEEILNRISISTKYDDLADMDIIIEAIPEDLSLKHKVFSELDNICGEETVFASNTSSIMITELAKAVKRKDKFIGMHWFNPAPIMPLIEVIRGSLTSEETFNLIMDLSRKIGKIPIEAGDGPGFFTTRFIINVIYEAIRLFEEGIADLKSIDEMCKLAFNYPMGPFELMDLIGLDTVLHIGEYIYEHVKEPRYNPPLTLKKLVLSGYLGDPRFKPGSKGGWYSFYKVKRE